MSLLDKILSERVFFGVRHVRFRCRRLRRRQILLNVGVPVRFRFVDIEEFRRIIGVRADIRVIVCFIIDAVCRYGQRIIDERVAVVDGDRRAVVRH